MKYSGIDLHSNSSVVTVTDEQDRIVAEKRLPWRDELAGVVVESTYNWYWLVDGLQEAGFVVKLANTAPSRSTTGSSTAATKPMPGNSPTYCDSASCQPAPFFLRNTGRSVI